VKEELRDKGIKLSRFTAMEISLMAKERLERSENAYSLNSSAKQEA
jgi:hypothetical protein